MGIGGFILGDTWVTEYAALCGSLVSLTVIVVLLAHFDRRPIFDSGIITLNTIVSIFSNISKGWLLLAVSEAISQWKWIAFSQRRRRLIEFEWLNQASRGPLGSLRLLLRTRGGLVCDIHRPIDADCSQLPGVFWSVHRATLHRYRPFYPTSDNVRHKTIIRKKSLKEQRNYCSSTEVLKGIGVHYRRYWYTAFPC